MKLLLALLALLACPLTRAEKLPATLPLPPYTAIYQAVYKTFPLQATHQLEQAGDDWHFASIASGFFGQIEENSTFAWTADGIRPLHYAYQRNILGHHRSSELTFNPTDNVAAGRKRDKPFTLTLKGNELDTANHALALRVDVARGITEPCYRVVEEDEIDKYCFRVTGRETIESALGKLDTVVVERVRKTDSPRRTRFWLAPSLDYVIARLEHQEQQGQTAYSLEITYYKPDTKP